MTSFECHKNGRERSVQKEVKKKVKDFFMKIVQFTTTIQYVSTLHKRDRTEPASGSLYSYTQDSNPEG